MEEEAQNEPAVDPIVVDLGERPSREELLELSGHMRRLQAAEEMGALGKALEVLHQY